MIVLQRTTRDNAMFIVPVLFILAAVLTWVALSANGWFSLDANISPHADWISPTFAALLWIALGVIIYRVMVPIIFKIEVHQDRVVFSDSTKPGNPVVLNRCDIKRFYVEPAQRWHNADAFYPVVYDTVSNHTEKISFNYVHQDTADEFFAAVRRQWGEEYVGEAVRAT